MFRLAIILIVLAGLGAGCVSRTSPSSSIRTKVAKKIVSIRSVQRRIKTASCREIDQAMAYTYVLHRLTSGTKKSKRISAARVERAARIFKIQLVRFRKEFRARCPGRPAMTQAMRKVYPDLVAEAKRRKAQRDGKSGRGAFY